jgi:hypothetical protein
MGKLITLGDNFAFDGGAENLSVINLKIVNAMSGTLTVSLFNVLGSPVNLGVASGVAYSGEAFNPFTAEDFDAVSLANKVYFADNGNLIYKNAAPANCTVSTEMANLTYRDIFNELSAGGMYAIKKLRFTVTTQAQIQQGKLGVVEYNKFGNLESDTYNLSNSFSPNQFQNTVLDVPLDIIVNRSKGLTLNVLTGQTINLDVFVESK